MGDKDTIDLFGHCSLGEQAEIKQTLPDNAVETSIFKTLETSTSRLDTKGQTQLTLLVVGVAT